MTPSFDIQKLVERCQSGDQDAFGQIYEHYVDSIYRYVYFKVDESDAEDLTETIFVKVWENVRQYKIQSGAQFSSWLFRIAHNVVVDHYRMNHSIEALVDDYQDNRIEHNPIHIANGSLDSEILKNAIGQLKGVYQQVLILKYMNNLSNKEIADSMKKSEGSLRILQYRALRALRKILDDKGFAY